MKISTEKYGKWQIVTIEDSFVVKHLNEIKKVLEPIEKRGVFHIAINLSKTTYIDSSAITVMLNFQKRLEKVKGDLVIFNANQDISDIFSIINLDNFIKIFPTRSEFEKEIDKG